MHKHKDLIYLDTYYLDTITLGHIYKCLECDERITHYETIEEED